MRIFRNPGEIPADFGPTVVSIGNFDGVHVGHRFILERLRRRAAELSAKSVAVTFAPHPLQVLRPDTCPLLITPIDTRLELLSEAGIDAVLVLPFTAALSRMSAAAFVTVIVHDGLRAIEVHEGPNFRFGYKAEGGIGELSEFGRSLGFHVVVHEACRVRGLTVSSSKIRDLLAAGNLGTGRALLGHAFFVDSTPASGRGIGSTLTVPTINLAPYKELLPANGVYVTRLRIGAGGGEENPDGAWSDGAWFDGAWFDAVTNVGNRPTFGEDSFAVESHLLDFQPVPLDDQTPLRLVFDFRLREEKRWPSPEALKQQILSDVTRAKRYLHLRRLLHQQTSG